jgi:hypothetical protein
MTKGSVYGAQDNAYATGDQSGLSQLRLELKEEGVDRSVGQMSQVERTMRGKVHERS